MLALYPCTETRQAKDAGQVIGANGFHWDALDNVQPFSVFRIYISSGWAWRPGGLFVEPMYQANTRTVDGYDTYFAEAKKRGIDIVPCIHQTPGWYRDAQKYNPNLGDDMPPVVAGGDRGRPDAYRDYAEFLAQFTKRYGGVKYPDSALNVDQTPRWTNDPPNEKKSGLNLIKYIEIWNEPDKWWKTGADAPIYMQPEHYAAMLSACYDAIKKADAKMTVVMGGITGLDTAYLYRMDRWFARNNMPFKADVINVHHYSNAGNDPMRFPPNWTGAGVAPESDRAFLNVGQFIAFAKFRKKQIWVSEFGYDTQPPSFLIAPAIAGMPSEQVQAAWLCRTYLEYIRLGVDRAFVFSLTNQPRGETGGGLFQSSGLIESTGRKKESYGAVINLAASLRGYIYAGDYSTNKARILSFKNDAGKTRIYYWLPTMRGDTLPIQLPGNPKPATETPQFIDVQ